MTENKNNEAITEAIDLLIGKGIDLSNALSEGGIVKQLTKRLVEKALESEMNNHLGYNRYDRTECDNARNGSSSKNILTDKGHITIDIPRDRKAEFEPAIIPKRQTRIDGLDQKILSLYAKGMSLSDIKIQIEELYGAQISESLISKITDDVL
jgi:putative transposase